MLEAKKRWVAILRERLERERETMQRLASDAAAAATHEENKPEGDKDMRSTEASYLARGQAERVRTIEQTILRLSAMPIAEFQSDDPIAVSACVEVQDKGARRRYFLVPAPGGEHIEDGDFVVDSLATTSPLGKALLGLCAEDEALVKTPQGERALAILTVR